MTSGYGKSLSAYDGPAPLLVCLRQEMVAAHASLRDLGILGHWQRVAESARAQARVGRKQQSAPHHMFADERGETEPANELAAMAYIAGTIEGAIGVVVAQHTAAHTAGSMRMWAWLHDGAPYVEFPGVDSDGLCSSASAAINEHLGPDVRFRMKDMEPGDGDRARFNALLAMVHQWPDMGSPSLVTEMLRAEFSVSAIARRGARVETWEDLGDDLWTIWLPEGGVGVNLSGQNGQAIVRRCRWSNRCLMTFASSMLVRSPIRHTIGCVIVVATRS